MAINSEALPAESVLAERAGELQTVPDVPIEQLQNSDINPSAQLETESKHRLARFWRFLGKAALVTGVFVGSGTVGMAAVGAPVHIGPLEGTAKLTFDHYATATLHSGSQEADTSVALPLNTPEPVNYIGFGLHATFNNPLVSITPSSITPKIRSEQELAQKAGLFANYDQEIKEDTEQIRRSFELYGLLGVMGLWGSTYAMTEARKRWPQRESLVRAARFTLAAGMIGLCAVPVTVDKITAKPGIDISQQIAGMPKDVRVAGELRKFVINTRKFGDMLIRHQHEVLPLLSPLYRSKDVQTDVLIEGNHGHLIMYRTESDLADDLHASYIIDAGDDALGGSELDQFLITNMTHEFRGHTVVKAAGQHDPVGPEAGITMLQGKVLRIGGLTILGDDYPMKNSGHGGLKHADRAETPAEMNLRLAEAACNTENGVDLFIVNEPSVAQEVIKRGCADFVFAGGYDSQYNTYLGASGREVITYFTRGSGGEVYKDTNEFSTAGKLKNTAEVTLLGLYKTGEGMAVTQSLIYNPDGTVEVGPEHRTALGQAILETRNSPQKQRALQAFLTAMAK